MVKRGRDDDGAVAPAPAVEPARQRHYLAIRRALNDQFVADLTRTIRASGCVPDGGEEEVYLADRGAIDRVGANEWGWMPPGAESVFVARNLLLASDEPRAFSKKQRSWARAIAKKLS